MYTECHEKVLKLFQDTPSSSVLDFSRISLQPSNIPPLLTSLQGHSSLTSLSLCGSRLKVEAVARLATSISRHPNIKMLDLSCTGLTAQVNLIYYYTVELHPLSWTLLFTYNLCRALKFFPNHLLSLHLITTHPIPCHGLL